MDKFFQWWADWQNKTAEEVVKEWHSWVHGFCEMGCFRIPPCFVRTQHAIDEMNEEEHYYQFGRFCAVLMWAVIILAVIQG